VSSVNGVNATNNQTSTSSEKKKPNELGKMDFLNILVTQLRYQDPMNPLDDKEFIAQLAQFSTLEQITEQTKWAQMSYGLGLVGQEVLFRTDDGQYAHGVVKSLRMVDGQPMLSFGNADIRIDQVVEVADSNAAAESAE